MLEEAVEFVSAVFVWYPKIGRSRVEDDIEILSSKSDRTIVLSILVVVNRYWGITSVLVSKLQDEVNVKISDWKHQSMAMSVSCISKATAFCVLRVGVASKRLGTCQLGDNAR